MSKASLKKALKGMDREALAELVCDLYDARREAREYLEYWLQPDPGAAFEKVKEETVKRFFYSSGRTKGLPSATEIKKLVNDFSSISFDPEKTAALLLHIAETQATWLSARTTGYAAGLRSLERNVENARIYVEQSGLEEAFSLRLHRLGELLDDLRENPPETRRGRRRRGWWR